MSADFIKALLKKLVNEYGLKALEGGYELLKDELNEPLLREQIKLGKTNGFIFDSINDFINKEFCDIKGSLRIINESENGRRKYYLIRELTYEKSKTRVPIYECPRCGIVKYDLEANQGLKNCVVCNKKLAFELD